MYYAHVLISINYKRTYVGSSKSVEGRLTEHNTGKNKSTKAFLPCKVLHVEQFDTRVEARKRERYFKSTSGRRKIREILENEKRI